MTSKIRRIILIASLWTGTAVVAYCQSPHPSPNGAPVRLRYGNASVLWPAQPHIVMHQRTNFAETTVYGVTVTPVTFCLSLLRFASPQLLVSPVDFAHNMTAQVAQAQILGIWRGQLDGYPAGKALYRRPQLTSMAWNVQPRPEFDYILTVGGPDSAQFRSNAEQFARSFRIERVR